VRPGEAVWFDLDGDVRTAQCHDSPLLSPCVFEYVYFGRPDSVMDGISVYRARQLVRATFTSVVLQLLLLLLQLLLRVALCFSLHSTVAAVASSCSYFRFH
jgi:hypothetical protein